ncbi:hypothetical protein EGW08_003009 [Elysia chlorotica]|uniref:Uncharacterized protein n=1 Tax=Elysia chlorotica TaxID=188477 RepID=A0A3S1BQS8_ELYCH|nr:hypothetical protein EGW08_003009 [Elysia chlorotica]
MIAPRAPVMSNTLKARASPLMSVGLTQPGVALTHDHTKLRNKQEPLVLLTIAHSEIFQKIYMPNKMFISGIIVTRCRWLIALRVSRTSRAMMAGESSPETATDIHKICLVEEEFSPVELMTCTGESSREAGVPTTLLTTKNKTSIGTWKNRTSMPRNKQLIEGDIARTRTTDRLRRKSVFYPKATREGGDTMTPILAGHNRLTPTQPVESDVARARTTNLLRRKPVFYTKATPPPPIT